MAKKAVRMGKAARRIMEGLSEARAWARGEPVPVRAHHIPRVDVKAARTKLGLSQDAFAERFGIPAATLRNWEQGRRQPETPTRILLAIIAKHPEIVVETLGGL